MAPDKSRQSRWINVEPGEWGVNSILQVGQILTSPEDPSTALLRREGPFDGERQIADRIGAEQRLKYNGGQDSLRADSHTHNQDLESDGSVDSAKSLEERVDSAKSLERIARLLGVDKQSYHTAQLAIQTTTENIYATGEFVEFSIHQPEVLDWLNRSDVSRQLFLITKVRKLQQRNVGQLGRVGIDSGVMAVGLPVGIGGSKESEEREFIGAYMVDQIILPTINNPALLVPYPLQSDVSRGDASPAIESSKSPWRKILRLPLKKTRSPEKALPATNHRDSSVSPFTPQRVSDVIAAIQPESLSSIKGKVSSERDSLPVPSPVDADDTYFARRSSVGSVPTINLPIDGANSSGLNRLTNSQNSPSQIDAERISIPPVGRNRSSSAPPAEDLSANAQGPLLDELPRAESLDVNSINLTAPNTSPPVASSHQGTLPTFNTIHHESSTSPFPNQKVLGAQSVRETPDDVPQGSRFELFDPTTDLLIASQTNVPAAATIPSIATDDESGNSLTDGSPIEASTWRETVFDSVKVQSVNDKPRALVEADRWLKSKACMGKVNVFMGNYRRLPLTANSKYTVKVAVLDTGIDLDHPLLESYKKTGQISQGLCNDLVTGKVPIRDSTGHGTHCAHTILKVCKTARLYIARVFESDEGDEAAVERIIKAIDWAVKSGVDIICMSFAFTNAQENLRRAIISAIGQRDILFFAAASNDRHYESDPVGFPASMDEVIRVNSCKHNGQQSDFSPNSDYRRDNALSTIGEEIEAAFPPRKNDGEPLKRLSGTSMSTAILAGIAALLIEFAKLQVLPASVASSMESRLHTSAGMKAVLYHCMAGIKPREAPWYNHIRPWVLFTIERKHDVIVHQINDALDRGL